MIMRRLTYCIIMAGLMGTLVCGGEQKPKSQLMFKRLRQLFSVPSNEGAQLRPVTQSNFEKIEALFKAGKRPSLKTVKLEALLSGKCVRRDSQEQFTRSIMSSYKVEKMGK